MAPDLRQGIVKTEDVNLATPGKSKKQRKQAAKKADAPKKTKAAPSPSVVGSSRDKVSTSRHLDAAFPDYIVPLRPSSSTTMKTL